MSSKISILKITPDYAIPGGEIEIFHELTEISVNDLDCRIAGISAGIVAASPDRILLRVPVDSVGGELEVTLSAAGATATSRIIVGEKIAEGLHIVANPAVDPEDGSIVTTKSGGRGQYLPETMFRVRDGHSSAMPVNVLSPTGVAFDTDGSLLVTNRADGELIRITEDFRSDVVASELGVATGIAINGEGTVFVGDRSGKVLTVNKYGDADTWVELPQSVSAYHMAFGPDDALYVSAPGLCSFDSVYRVNGPNDYEVFYKGLGRPQGLAFDRFGYLFVAACLRGRHGIVRIPTAGGDAEWFLAGYSIVGLCFTSKGGLVVATSDSLFEVELMEAGVMG
ncbi:MAG: hypothetical protein R2684_01590 [Pyrinomonadaceae bacterium]